MYEDKTFENILSSMLAKVPDNIDKREGSVIYNALAPAAYELAQAYFLMDNLFKLAFVDTSEGEYLTKLCSQCGVNRKPATTAIRKGVFKDGSGNPFNVPVGSRFGIDGIAYAATNKISDGVFEMTCETPGTAGNTPSGYLLPIDNVPGLGTAELSDVIVYGEDEETDEALRERTLARVRLPTTSGNANDYKQWACEVVGVGGAKVFPLWDGPGTVKVVIVDNNKQPASLELISAVSAYIEEIRPIGALVTVAAAAAKTIDISATVVLAQGYTIQSVKDLFEEAVRSYFKDIALTSTYVSYAKIGTILLSMVGVLDYSNLLLNGSSVNVALGNEEVPVLGFVSLGV